MVGNALEVEGLEKSFGPVKILQGIDIAIPKGSITAIVGPNGSGKTTLFHAISGDSHADAGTVVLGERQITRKPPWKIARQGLGKLFQDVRVFDELTIIENMLVAMHHRKGSSRAGFWTNWRSKKSLASEATSLLREVGVEEPYNRHAGELSFGNQKLLALARLVVGDFDVLLLDEPTTGVAEKGTERLTMLIKDLARDQGLTIILIEHNLSFVLDVADTVYVLREGQVFDHGAPSEVLAKPLNRELLIGI